MSELKINQLIQQEEAEWQDAKKKLDDLKRDVVDSNKDEELRQEARRFIQ